MILKHIKNNNGSTILLVLVTMIILSIMGTTILSLAVTNYKMVSINSKVKKNFYFSEAGIEEIYAIIGDFIREAINEAETVTDDFIVDVYELMPDDEDYDTYFDEDGSLKESEDGEGYVLEEEAYKLFEDTYKDYLLDKMKGNNGLINNDGTLNTTNFELKIKSNQNNTPQINFFTSEDGYSGDSIKFIDDEDDENYNKIVFDIESEFNQDNIDKKVRVTYKISVPEYNSQYYETTSVIQEPLDEIWDEDFVLLADEDIILKEGNITINGKTVTHNDFRIKSSDGVINIHGNLYAKENFYIDNGANNNTISFNSYDGLLGSIYLNDDFEIDGNSNTIEINGSFYGLSDSSNAGSPDESSSIIMNGIDTDLTFKGDLIIHGSSFINLNNDKYQTGESISIKGNYKAYTKEIEPKEGRDFDKDDISFEYIEPLSLAYRKNGKKLNLLDKSKYIKYYNEDTDGNSLNLEGIDIKEIGNSDYNIIYSGAIIHSDGDNKDRVKSGNCIPEDELIIREKQSIFDDNMSVATQNVIDSGKYNKINQDINSCYSDDEILYYSSMYNSIAIVGSNLSQEEYPSDISALNEEQIIKLSQDYVDGIVITNGDVYLAGDIDYNGIIFANNIIICNAVSVENQVKLTNNKSFIEDKFKECGILGSILETTIEIGTGGDGATVKKDKLIELESWSIER